jgi:hypothetical protein
MTPTNPPRASSRWLEQRPDLVSGAPAGTRLADCRAHPPHDLVDAGGHRKRSHRIVTAAAPGAAGICKLEKTDFDVTVDATTAGVSVVVRPGSKPVIGVLDQPGWLQGKLGWRRGELQPGGDVQLTLPVRDDMNGKVVSTTATLGLTVGTDEL